jgi:segregation and condensation protein A
VVAPQAVTIGQQMGYIWRELSSGRPVSFNTMLTRSKSRIEVIVTLLAVLELIKRRIIIAEQAHHYSDIIINRTENTNAVSEADWDELLTMTEVS